MAVFLRWSSFHGVLYILINLKMGNSICNMENYNDYNYDDQWTYVQHMYCQHIEEHLEDIEYDGRCTRVTISDSNIPEISTAAFLNVDPSMEDLDLSGNRIKNIRSGAFSGPQALRILDLHNNQIVKISNGIFNHLVKLKFLDLSENKISSIDPNFLTGVNISSLNLARNALKSFENVLVGQNSYVRMLNLSRNEISLFNLNRFNCRINTLDISNNKLTFVNICFPGLQNLDVSYNEISQLLADTCYLNTSPLNLTISYNLLNEESVMNVSKLLKLEMLDMAGNNLSFIPVNLFVNLTNLVYLNMSHNKISYLNYGALDHVRGLQILDLSYNKLTTIKRYLHSLSALRALYINNNKITNISSKQLLNDIGPSVIMNIDNNDFICENLVEVVHDYSVFIGTSKMGSNINGIACKEETLPKANHEVKFENDVEESESKGFKNSKFNKYLEELKNINTLNFNGTDMLKYFNQDFKNSLVYKYLENLKANESSAQLATHSVLIILLIILVLFKVVKIYSNYKNSKKLLSREQVELIDTSNIQCVQQ
ncbi:leucine-rich repeat-containing protein let-4-like [Diabrotica virgifera virgifera]|uniref:Leucine-rich repeat-containing protein let-4-like n=1 Tax=Diabrotica virgifera virgifera TaxID=50390 RepID=A0A6P7G7Q0_DIAVI|nr:leucine-rich repeat-containing protein let-4-like [Diabrotica virgifera virgifera]